MKVKNLNPIELHIEKAILGVAVLAMFYMAWATHAPTTLDESGTRPADVERKVTQSVDEMEKNRKATNDLIQDKKLTAAIQDYVAQYRDTMAKPLSNTLLTKVFPVIGPSVIPAPKTKNTDTVGQEYKFASVKFPELTEPVQADLWQGSVATVSATAVPVVRDARIVRLGTHYPFGQLRDDIEQAKNPLPAKFQVFLIGRAEWERQERVTGGAWSAWKPLPQLSVMPKKDYPAEAPLNTLPTDVMLERLVTHFTEAKPGGQTNQAGWALSILLNNMGHILQPALPGGFYEPVPGADAMHFGPAASTAPAVIPTTLVATTRPIIRTPASMAVGGTMGEGNNTGGGGEPDMAPPPDGRTPPPMPDGRTPPPIPHSPGEIFGAAGGGAPEPVVNIGGNPQEYSALTTQDTVDVTRFDDTVQPGHEYRYHVRLHIYNPIYMWPKTMIDLLVNKEDANKAFFVTKWSDASKPIIVDPADYFFFVQAGGGVVGQVLNVVAVDVFHWQQGKWFRAHQSDVGIGGQIGSTLPPEFATTNTIVDITPTSSGSATIVLLDAAGQLTYRSVAEDLTSSKLKELGTKAVAVTPATRPGPTTGTSPTQPGRTPPPPPPPSTGRTPPPAPKY